MMRAKFVFTLNLAIMVVGCQDAFLADGQAVSAFIQKRSITVGDQHFVIDEYNPFYSSCSLRPVFRVPNLVITEKGTMLVACENRDIFDDTGPIDVLVSRRSNLADDWVVTKEFCYDYPKMDHSRSMNPTFCIDTSGVHGARGRIFLFASRISSNVRYAFEAKSKDIDFVYKYSDDDGITWSPEYSIKNKWVSSQYEGVIPSPANGVQTADGSLIIPTMVITEGFYKSGLCIKPVGGDWFFSSPSPTSGDNECTVYIDNNYQIVLDCRTTSGIRRKYIYNEDDDSFSLIDGSFPIVMDLKAEISRFNWQNKNLYFLTFCDSTRNIRENISLWGSKNGMNWRKVFQMTEGDAITAYSNISYGSGILAAVYEDYDEGIRIQDFTPLKDIVFSIVANTE